MSHLPPPFEERPPLEQIIAAIVVPLVFGIVGRMSGRGRH